MIAWMQDWIRNCCKVTFYVVAVPVVLFIWVYAFFGWAVTLVSLQHLSWYCVAGLFALWIMCVGVCVTGGRR